MYLPFFNDRRHSTACFRAKKHAVLCTVIRFTCKAPHVSFLKNYEIVYVIRKGQKGPTPMVKNREPIDSSFITLIFSKDTHGYYILLTATIGRYSKPEPWDNIFYNTFSFYQKSGRQDGNSRIFGYADMDFAR